MTLRISQFAAVCGLSLLALPGVVQAQAPRYQSPIGLPATPQQQLSLPSPQAISPNGSVVEDVIVRVNDQIINRSDLERSVQQMAAENQQNNASPAEIAERQKNLLRDMIDQQLLLSRAKELGMNADAEVIRRLDEIRKQNHLDTMDDLEKAARQQGVSYEDFKANIRNSILTQQVVRDEVGRRLQMTQAQEQAYYEAHKQDFAQPEQVRLSEILVPLPAEANEAAIAQAQAKANDIGAKLNGGAKFNDLAEAYSGGPTASQGGDLGLFKRGALAKVLEDQTFDLKAGESTAPIRTRQGFVILKVTEHQAAGVPPMKDVENEIQNAMYMEQMQPALRAYLTKLREDAYIDIAQGFVDSGASAKQTKPVFTAYSAPVSKKQKKAAQEKKRFDRGGRFSTAKTTPAPAVTPVATTATAAGAATTTTATATTAKASNPAKPKKMKREKVRYGQAPRNALPEGPQEAAGVGGDTGEGAAPAPGAAMTMASQNPTQIASATDDNPLTPKAPVVAKTRYSARAKTEKADKEAAKATKAKEKAALTPAPMSSDEKATTQTQAAPLGLNGDTAKKKKKTKVAGAPKERLQDKEKQAPVQAPAPEPTVNPALGAAPGEPTPPPAPAPAPAATTPKN